MYSSLGRMTLKMQTIQSMILQKNIQTASLQTQKQYLEDFVQRKDNNEKIFILKTPDELTVTYFKTESYR